MNTLSKMLEGKSNQVMFFGDWHGDINYALYALERAYTKFPEVDVFYHVGDFGLWPGSDYYLDSVADSLHGAGKEMIVTGGNHEDWPRWSEMVKGGKPHNYENLGLIFLPKLYTWTHGEKNFMSLGGASSIDQDYRVENISWWKDEEIQRSTVLEVLEGNWDVDVLITHEASDDPVPPIQRILNDAVKQANWSQRVKVLSEYQRNYVGLVLHKVDPEMHIHGHWHIPYVRDENDLKTISLGDNSSSYAENSYIVGV